MRLDSADVYEMLAEQCAKTGACHLHAADMLRELIADIESNWRDFEGRVNDYAYGSAMERREAA